MTRWINHRQVETFHVVMLTGSMTAAGELLGISQPAVSRLIREFESKVGFLLFKRNGSNIKPTSEAVMLHREVNRSLQGLSRIESAAVGIAQLKSDTLQVTATYGLSIVYLTRTIRQFELVYPEVSITVNTGTMSSVVDKLTTSYFDVGMAFFSGEIQGLEIEPLCSVEAVCLLPKGHRLAGRDVIHVEDLSEEPLICQEQETQIQYKVSSVFRAANIEPIVKTEANLTVMMCKLVEAGMGVAIVEPITAISMRDTLLIKPFRPVITLEPAIAFPSHRSPTDFTQAFADHFKKLFLEDFGGRIN